MAILEILRLGHPVLRRRARELTPGEIGSPELAQLVRDMVETMHDAQGIGLAAPQVGAAVRLALVEVPDESERYPGVQAYPFGVYINPVVRVLDPTPQGFWEGCLSVPGLRGFVERPRKIEVRYLDLQGAAHTLVAEDFPATVFQHEFDHLDGTLYVDRLRSTRELAYLEEFNAFQLASGERADALGE